MCFLDIGIEKYLRLVIGGVALALVRCHGGGCERGGDNEAASD